MNEFSWPQIPVISGYDAALATFLGWELLRPVGPIRLLASPVYASKKVLTALTTVLTPAYT
jgi:hypothetical protein